MSSTIQNQPQALSVPSTVSPALQQMLGALSNHQFFKLIGGGSLTEAEKLVPIAKTYSVIGAQCIDIAPEPAIIDAIAAMMSEFSQQAPVLMISLPLDPDPHFRKIDLTEPDCIRCGACLPVCPTEALTLPDALEVSQTLCYGCGRCVPTCPTDALSLLPFQVEAQLEVALNHPSVEAVEIHSHYVDPFMLQALFERWGSCLTTKLLSLCFRPGDIPSAQILEFYRVAQQACPLPVMLQIDGAPMSGNDAPEASLPALAAAVQVARMFEEAGQTLPFITISGGINQHTAALLKEPEYQFIAGVGMGTVARKAIWHCEETAALTIAQQIAQPFITR